MLFKANQKIVFIGDSITDYNRRRPVGEGLFEGIGRSYVVLVDALLRTGYPELKPRLVNMGEAGNRVRELKKRWQTDVLDLKPDWVCVLVGVNDVGRQFDSPLMPEEHVYLPEYEAVYEELILATKDRVSGMILMTPFYMEPNGEEPMRKTLDQYGGAVKRLGAKHGCHTVDLQYHFDQFMRHYSAQSMSPDRVHPDMLGHIIIARAFLDCVGFEWKRE
jgi:lysophospholipase L1-like esterase